MLIVLIVEVFAFLLGVLLYKYQLSLKPDDRNVGVILVSVLLFAGSVGGMGGLVLVSMMFYGVR